MMWLFIYMPIFGVSTTEAKNTPVHSFPCANSNGECEMNDVRYWWLIHEQKLCERTLTNQLHLRTQMPGQQKVKESKKGLMRELRVNCRKSSIYV